MERRMGEVYGKTCRKAKQIGFSGIQAPSKLEWEMQESHRTNSQFEKHKCHLAVHAYDPSTREVKAGGL